ncbi:MAG: hypothetical protein H6Q80_396 [Deltaproteobacteria bacterium]|nr:hypothetical protein [Deltaproteobacteria bacterium]
MSRNVLYATLYPGVEKYFPDWLDSTLSQDMSDFDIWFGLDNVSADIVPEAVRRRFGVEFVGAGKDATPIGLRNHAMEWMSGAYDAIVFADSDDILEPTRISSSLLGLENADIHGCALGLINGHGNDLQTYFGLTEGEDPGEVLPRYNFLGLSNTAWRAGALRDCLPARPECVAMDWFLATTGWCQGLRISFDRKIGMRYRQHGANIACVVPPFTSGQILKATDIVCGHYRLLMENGIPMPERKRKMLEDAASRAGIFKTTIGSSLRQLEAYVNALNQRPAHRLWWLTVAHPDLEDIWNC